LVLPTGGVTEVTYVPAWQAANKVTQSSAVGLTLMLLYIKNIDHSLHDVTHMAHLMTCLMASGQHTQLLCAQANHLVADIGPPSGRRPANILQKPKDSKLRALTDWAALLVPNALTLVNTATKASWNTPELYSCRVA
jgi:hypothetical protein